MKTRSRNDNNDQKKPPLSYLFSLTFLCLSFLSLLSWSDDFQKGMNAVESGDFTTAIEIWARLAEQGESRAQFSLGVMYKFGVGVNQDAEIAVKWWKLAA
tara:strand:+ start:612 stop:911 length:300 start_codon:yes stop_codon:yes gene_type:complete